IYPSHVTQQNPQTMGWDPLQIAVDEAHKQNVELHAWVWVFAVGNTRHNRLLDLPDSYPGPILSTRPDLMSAALRGPGGELVLPGQFEYWLSPASRKARQFLTTLFSEVVQNYDVDGLQLDYIRYPFQKPGHYVGYEHVSRTRYSAETGMSDYVGTSGFQAWQAWKAFQVTTFVKELSAHLRQIKPDLKLSAAVFPMHRHKRMQMIQQDWETWVRKGWVETLNPMAYSNSAHSLVGLVDYVHQVGGDKVLVYPGLSLLKLNAVELVDKMEMIRDKGLLGTALFAYAHFGPDTQYLVQSGPYLEKNVISPHRKPLLASRQLTKEVLAMVNNLLKAKDQDTNYEVLYEIQHKLVAVDEALNALSKPSLSRTDAHYYLEVARNDALGIERLMESWRQATEADSVEAYRANYLNDNVAKMVRMVNYATYKQQLEFDRQGLSMQPALPNSPSPTSTNPPPPTAVPKVSVLLKP
ncbi:MAG: family 10 glycosylhydrolase, partial [Cyanobacteria bacterium HKST-UBA06]|nr:family 10 glycosylhydrolase [Cyanobacteria bacterium HKST-UBA06]